MADIYRSSLGKKLHQYSPHNIFSMKSPDPTLSTSSKLKNVLQAFILSHLCGICRSLRKAKGLVIQVVELSTMKKKKNKLFLGSFRMHYNWCSSHVVPVMEIALSSSKDIATNWSSSSSSSSSSMKSSSTDNDDKDEDEDEDARRLSGYLHWLEGKAVAGNVDDVVNEIDRLADMFIADSHEKFRLEKVESYRRFQEMLARSV